MIPSPLSTLADLDQALPVANSPAAFAQTQVNAPVATSGEARQDYDDGAELEAYRAQALLRNQAAASASTNTGIQGIFEPFVGSRVGSPIPDPHGLGWPGTDFSDSQRTFSAGPETRGVRRRHAYVRFWGKGSLGVVLPRIRRTGNYVWKHLQHDRAGTRAD